MTETSTTSIQVRTERDHPPLTSDQIAALVLQAGRVSPPPPRQRPARRYVQELDPAGRLMEDVL